MSINFKKLVIAGTLIIFFGACYKIDWKDFPGDHVIPKCDLASYKLTMYPQVTHPFLFTKTYDHTGRVVSTIDASFFNLLGPEDLIHYRLRIEFRGRNMYLINLDNASDTSMIVRLNKYGKPEFATGDETLGSYEFYYNNNRLSSVKWKVGIEFTCVYDQDGNILSMTYPSELQGRSGYFYKYDYTRKAKQQFYMDDLRYLDDGFTLLQYLGLFPELSPVNLRIHTRMGEKVVAEGTGTTIWDKYLINHKLDAWGKLVSYDVASNYNGNYDTIYQALLQWNCR